MSLERLGRTAYGVTSSDIATLAALWHDQKPWNEDYAWNQCAIPVSESLLIAAGFAEAVIFALVVPRDELIPVPSDNWGLAQERECVILHEVPRSALIREIDPEGLARATVDAGHPPMIVVVR